MKSQIYQNFWCILIVFYLLQKRKNDVLILRFKKNTRVNKKFYKVFGTIRQFRILSPRSWKKQTNLDYERPGSPDALWMLLVRFISMDWSSVIGIQLLPRRYSPVRICKAYISKLDLLHVYFRSFKIPHGMKQCTMGQRTN